MSVFVPVDKWGSLSHAIPMTDKKEERQSNYAKGKGIHKGSFSSLHERDGRLGVIKEFIEKLRSFSVEIKIKTRGFFFRVKLN